MAAESEHPSASPLLSQLHQSLQQLEQVVGQLETDSQQRQQLPPNTLRRLEATTARVADYLSGTGAESDLVDAPDSDQDWDGIDELLDAFDTPTETAAPTPAPGDRPRPTTAGPSTIAKTQSPLWFVRWVAAGLLGIFIGVGLWIGYPPLSIPPLLTWLNQQFLTPSVSEIREPSTESSGLVGPPVEIESPSPVATTAEPAGRLPENLIAPAPPQEIDIKLLPEAPLTPEQSLVAVIQQELMDMEDVYPPQLLQQLIPNFPQSLLTLKLGNQWQTLSARQKQTTLETLWQRSQRLSFQKLRIYDRQGNLLARSPVVGKDLVILTPLASVQPAA